MTILLGQGELNTVLKILGPACGMNLKFPGTIIVRKAVGSSGRLWVPTAENNQRANQPETCYMLPPPPSEHIVPLTWIESDFGYIILRPTFYLLKRDCILLGHG